VHQKEKKKELQLCLACTSRPQTIAPVLVQTPEDWIYLLTNNQQGQPLHPVLVGSAGIKHNKMMRSTSSRASSKLRLCKHSAVPRALRLQNTRGILIDQSFGFTDMICAITNYARAMS
jgi:hypothetical protein